jgi:GNAT superfamily N-acetyltransferase
MKVRAAAPSDAGCLAELATQLGYPSTGDDIRRRLPLVAGDGHCLRVADLDGRVAGWIHAVHVTLLDSDPYVEIKALVVDEGARGRRIGEALLDEVESWARQRGCSAMRVRSNVVRQRAHRFYERLGYEIVKTQRVFAKTLAD